MKKFSRKQIREKFYGRRYQKKRPANWIYIAACRDSQDDNRRDD